MCNEQNGPDMQPWIRQALHDARAATGMSHMDFVVRARNAGERLSTSDITRCEKGEAGVTDRVVDAYAAALDVHPVVLWGDALRRWKAADEKAGAEGRAATRRLRTAARRLSQT